MRPVARVSESHPITYAMDVSVVAVIDVMTREERTGGLWRDDIAHTLFG